MIIPYLIGWRRSINYVKGSVFADNDETILDFFKQYGFNVYKDIKNEKLTKTMLNYILEYNTDFIRDLQKSGGFRSHIIYKNKHTSVCAIKTRTIDPRNNRGKSGGFRIYSLLGAKDGMAIIFHLYPKTGSNREDNIDAKEKTMIKKMIDSIDAGEA